MHCCGHDRNTYSCTHTHTLRYNNKLMLSQEQWLPAQCRVKQTGVVPTSKPPHLINVCITVANVIHAHPCSEGVKELGEAHLSWQSPVWELHAQSNELDTSGGIERRQKKDTLITKHSLATEQFSNQPESSLENLCNLLGTINEYLLYIHICPKLNCNKHLCIEITTLNREYFHTKAK